MSDLPPILGQDQPESPERTQQIGNILAEAVRALNYATIGTAPGLEDPGDAYTLLGHLYTATGRFSQLFTQLNQFLNELARTGLLAEAGGQEAAGTAKAHYALGEAHRLAGQLTKALQAAQNATSGLYLAEPDGEDGQ